VGLQRGGHAADDLVPIGARAVGYLLGGHVIDGRLLVKNKSGYRNQRGLGSRHARKPRGTPSDSGLGRGTPQRDSVHPATGVTFVSEWSKGQGVADEKLFNLRRCPLYAQSGMVESARLR
jgi:hypothetical protein